MKQTIIFPLLLALFILPAVAVAQESEQWSRFRGPNGQGISQAVGLPTEWSDTENVAWKTSIPGTSWSSPVVWNDHIFVTTSTDTAQNNVKECRVLAIDRKNGNILWNKMLFTQEVQQKHPRNTEATPTPVTDGQRVYVLFANGHFAALDFEGNIVWKNTDLKFYSHHGFGASPIIYKDLLITAVNPSSTTEPVREGWQIPWDRSYLLALDKNTGKERWRGARGMTRISHSTPVVVQVDGKDQIVSLVGDVVQGFEPDTGELIWTARKNGEPAVPTPAIGEGMVFVSPAPHENPMIAVKLGGKGDVTDTHIVWEQRRNTPLIASLLYANGCLYSANGGTFAAHDPKTGEVYWEQRIQGAGDIDSSPIFADGKLYVTTSEGVTRVFKPNADPKKAPEVLASNDIGERVQATLAIAGNQIIIRTDKTLWCFGK